MLIALGGAPDYKLVYWNWDKMRAVAVVSASPTGSAVYQCSFNPEDDAQICVSGNGVFRLFKVTENILKPVTQAIGKREPQVRFFFFSFLLFFIRVRSFLASFPRMYFISLLTSPSLRDVFVSHRFPRSLVFLKHRTTSATSGYRVNACLLAQRAVSYCC